MKLTYRSTQRKNTEEYNVFKLRDDLKNDKTSPIVKTISKSKAYTDEGKLGSLINFNVFFFFDIFLCFIAPLITNYISF